MNSMTLLLIWSKNLLLICCSRCDKDNQVDVAFYSTQTTSLTVRPQMYKLTRVSLHNWYLVDALDIEIHGSTAIIGQTGAGKSSVLDAIQTALSGNNRNVIELNAA